MSIGGINATLTFSLATPSQAPPLTALINAAFRSEPAGQTWLYHEKEKRTDILPLEVTESLIGGPQSVMLVGTLPDAPDPIATCFLRKPSSSPEPHMTPGAAWFGLLAVNPEYHHRGYGLAIFKQAEQFVRDTWGLRRLEMDFVNTRTELRAWYESCGYRATGARREFPYGPNGRDILADGLEMLVLGKDL